MSNARTERHGTIQVGVALANGQLWNAFHNGPSAIGTPTRNTVAKKRAGQNVVDSDYLFVNAKKGNSKIAKQI